MFIKILQIDNLMFKLSKSIQVFQQSEYTIIDFTGFLHQKIHENVLFIVNEYIHTSLTFYYSINMLIGR